jgi:hypothetical protein
MSLTDLDCPICGPETHCPGYERLWLNLQANPDRWRPVHDQLLARKAQPLQYPRLMEQATNAAGALIRAAASGFAHVSQAEQDRRLAICRGDDTQPKCNFYDPSQGRCFKCGCVAAWKARLVSEHCPLDPPRW